MENVSHISRIIYKVPCEAANSLVSNIRGWYLLLLALVISVNVTYSQKKTLWDSSNIAKNTLYFEFLGNGGLYSINYDRILFSKSGFKISARVGISYTPAYLAYNNVFYYPMEVNFMYGKKKSHLEFGVGYTPGFNLYPRNLLMLYDFYSCPNLRLGYRLQNPNGGFFLRTGVLLLFQDGVLSDMSSEFTTAGRRIRLFVNLISLGYTFKNTKSSK